MTIKSNQVIELLLEACPSFKDAWATIEHENIYDNDRLHYMDASDFLRHLATLQLAGTTDEFPAIFDLIERLVVEGDRYVSNLAVIGYLEGLQMATISAFGLDPEVVFRPWFRPVSEAWWRRLNRFWGGEHSALRVSNAQISAEAHGHPNGEST